MTDTPRLIHGRMHVRFGRNGQRLAQISDDAGNRIEWDLEADTATFISPRGERQPPIPLPSGNLAFDRRAISPEFAESLQKLTREGDAVMNGDSTFRKAVFSLQAATVGIGITLRQGDITNLSRALQERAQLSLETPHSSAAPPQPARQASIETLGQAFRQEAAAGLPPVTPPGSTHPVTQLRAEAAPPDVGALGAWNRSMAGTGSLEKPTRQAPAQEVTGQPDHGLSGTGTRRQTSTEILRC